MIAQFSPPARRLVAIGLTILAALICVQALVLPLAALLRSSLEGYHASGERLQRLRAIADRPDAPRSEPVPVGLSIPTHDALSAGAVLTGSINAARDRASLKSLDLIPVEADPATPQLVSVQLHVVGPTDAVLTLISELEHRQPLVRFARWKLTAVQGQPGQIEFAGTAQAIWADIP